MCPVCKSDLQFHICYFRHSLLKLTAIAVVEKHGRGVRLLYFSFILCYVEILLCIGDAVHGGGCLFYV